MSDNVKELSERMAKVIRERGWERFDNPTQQAMDIAVEAGELLELFQWKPEKDLPQHMKEKKERIEAELADVFLSCIKFATINDIDLISAAWKKVEEMELKYPADKVRASGSWKKHNEL